MSNDSSRYDMPSPGKRDLEEAAEFRDRIHEKVLETVRETNPDIESVCDPYSVEDYFQWNWEYPGAWYLYVAIPKGFRSRKAFIDFLVKKTLEQSWNTCQSNDTTKFQPN